MGARLDPTDLEGQFAKQVYLRFRSLFSDLNGRSDVQKFGYATFRFIAEWQRRLWDYDDKQKSKITRLEKRVAELEKRFLLTPANSHKAPSSERHKKIKNSREPSSSKVGGQLGHRGATRELNSDPDIIHRFEPARCIRCRRSLKDVSDQAVIRKQVIDLKDGKPEVTEYQSVVKLCPDCGQISHEPMPQTAPKAKVVIGSGAKSTALYLMVQQLIPVKRTQEILWDLFKFKISQASLCSFVKEGSAQLFKWEQKIKTSLIQSKVLHFDETGIRVEKRSDWIHVVSHDQATLLNHHSKRGLEAIDEIGVLPEFRGHAVHDAYSAYFSFEKSGHSLCHAHILRELKYFEEEEKQKWAKSMRAFLRSTIHALNQGKKRTKTFIKTSRKLYFEILRHGFRENGLPDDWKKRPPDRVRSFYDKGRKIKIRYCSQRKHTPVVALLNRLRDRSKEALAFVRHAYVPFTNNQAERDLRMAKLKDKISGCFRSVSSAKAFLRCRSFLSTLRKQNQLLLPNLASIFPVFSP